MTVSSKCHAHPINLEREASGLFILIQALVDILLDKLNIDFLLLRTQTTLFICLTEEYQRFELGNMFENGCYLRRQKRFKIPKSEREPGSGHKSRSKDGSLRHGRGHGHTNGHHSTSDPSDHDIKKPSLKTGVSGELFGSGVLPPLTGPGTAAGGNPSNDTDNETVGLTTAKIEKHDYKYNISDKYGVDPTDLGVVGSEHLVLPAAPGLTKTGSDPYNPDSITGDDKYDKYQTPDMSHLHSNLDHLHSRYSLSEGLLSLRPPTDSAYPTSNPFSIHRLLPGPGSPMHPSLSKSDLQYGDYSLQHHSLHHDSMYYQPPVYQVPSLNNV